MPSIILCLLLGVSLLSATADARALLFTPCFDAVRDFPLYFNESATTCTSSAIATCQASINATFVDEAAAGCAGFNTSNIEFNSNCFVTQDCPCADTLARADIARHSAGNFFLELAACARASPSGCTAEAFEFELFANESLARDCAATESFIKTSFTAFASCYIFCNGPTSAPTPSSLAPVVKSLHPWVAAVVGLVVSVLV